jgi:hypothetical protein
MRKLRNSLKTTVRSRLIERNGYIVTAHLTDMDERARGFQDGGYFSRSLKCEKLTTMHVPIAILKLTLNLTPNITPILTLTLPLNHKRTLSLNVILNHPVNLALIYPMHASSH